MRKAKKLVGALLVVFLAASVMAGFAVSCQDNSLPQRAPDVGGTDNGGGGTTNGGGGGTNNGGGGGTSNNGGGGTSNGGGGGTSNGGGGGDNGGGGGGDPDDPGPGEPIEPGGGNDYGNITNNEISPYQWVIASGTANFNSGTAAADGYISISCMGGAVVEINGMLGNTNKASAYDGVTFEIAVSERMDVLVMLREEHDGKAWRLSETKNVNTNGQFVQYKSPFSMAQDTGWNGNYGVPIKSWLGTSRSLLLFICPSNGGKDYKLRKVGFYKGTNSASTETTILWTPAETDNKVW